MDNTNLENLKKIAKIFSPDNIITSIEIDQVLKGIMEILATYKKGTETINEETKQVVNSLLEQIVKYNTETITEFKTEAEKAQASKMQELQSFLSDVKSMVLDIETMASELQDGKDADEEKIVEDVISRIKIDPTVITVSAEEVKNKLESLQGDNKLDISAVKGFDLYSKKVDLDYAVQTLQHQTSTLLNRSAVRSIAAGTNVTVDNTDPSNPIISASGGSGSGDVTGPASSTDNAIARYDATTGKIIQNSGITIDDSNNITDTGTRFYADLTNATKSSRFAFQSSTTNGTAGLGVIPNGTATTGSFFAYNGSDPDNSSYGQFHADAAHVGINSSKTGTGTTQPIKFQIDNTDAVLVTTAGKLSTPNQMLSTSDYSSTTPAILIGGGTNVSNFALSIAAGRGMAGLDLTTGSFYINGGSSKNIALYVNGTAGTPITGTLGLFVQGNSASSPVGNVSINNGTTAPTAKLHLGAGTATASTAPLKFTAGTVTTTPEAGTLEFTNAETGLTFTAVSTRRQVVLDTATQTLTNKTLTTPVLNGTPTGTGVATAATVSTLALRDANGNLTAVNHIEGYTTTATAAGTTTMTITSSFNQVFTGTSTQTVKLPTTSVVAGGQYVITNNSTGLVTVQSSGANNIVILGTGMTGSFTANTATPTTAAHWGYSLTPYTDINVAVTATANAATVNLAYLTNTITNNSAATLTITIPTAGAINGEVRSVRVLDFSAAAQTITWVNTENSDVSAPTTSNGSTTLPRTVCFMYNSATSKWRVLANV
jgi:hypothetical protein